MPHTSTPTEIIRLLTERPRTSGQLADICGLHQRYIRHTLRRLVVAGIVSVATDSRDRRSRIYSITTLDLADPLIDPLNLGDQIEDHGTQQGIQKNQTKILPSCDGKIGDQNRGSFDPQKDPLNLEDQTINLTSYKNVLRNHGIIIPNCDGKIGDHLGDQNRGSFRDVSQQNAGNQNSYRSMHGNPENPPQFLSEIGDLPEIGDQNRGSNHPGTCSITETPSGHTCRNCPLTVCDLEHDAIQFGIIDTWTADHLPKLAAAKRWDRRQNPHTGVWTIYPPALHPLTLQIGPDSITVYSSEPGDTNWIIAWFGLQIGPQHPHPEQLAHKLRHPEIYRDEQTIVVRDHATIEAIRSVSAPYADPQSRVVYIESPNTTTPALKIYERDGTMRIEFDARDETRARAALVMRQEILQLLPQIALHPGLYLQWRARYYNPITQPVIINLEQDSVVAALKTLNETLTCRFEEIEAKISNIPTQTELQALIDEIDQLSDFELAKVISLITRYLGSRDAAYVFLSAWALWAQSRYHRSIIAEDVAEHLRALKTPISLSRIADALDVLTTRQLIKLTPEHTIRFTRAAITIGKKLMAREQAPEE